MNVFIYDSFLNQKKYDRLLARLETRITDLGLNGKIARLSLMRNIKEIVDHELKRGAKTIIAVGNNGTVNQIVNSLVGSPVPLGIIPIEETNNDIANSLGINSVDQACDILSARLLARLDLGLANQTYFLGHAVIENQGTKIDLGKNFTVETSEKGLIKVYNLADPERKLLPRVSFSPEDGILELVIKTQGNKKIFSKPDSQSVFKINKITITNPRACVILDGSLPLATPVKITAARQSLNVIVGKGRNF